MNTKRDPGAKTLWRVGTTICLGAAMLSLTGTSNAAGQNDEQRVRPTAMAHQLAPLKTIKTEAMPSLDYAAIEAEDMQRDALGDAPRFAIPFETKITPHTNGTWERVDAKTMVWRLRLTAPNAVSINLGFTQYAMPEGGRLFFYSADETMVIRPFTAADNAAHGELWTPMIHSNDVVVEVTIPTRARRQLRLELGSVNLGYKSFSEIVERSGSCNLDVVCSEGDDWRGEISAVGVISQGGSTNCTGFMVNNATYDRTPYFMTANHCGVSSSNAASLVVYWNYENSWCRAPDSPESGDPGDGTLDEFQTGSFFRSASSASDFTLVELDEDPNPDWNVGFAGWDRSGADATQAIAIHHPNTDEKRISFEYQPTTITDYLGTAVPGDGTHVRVEDWDLGTTEPGSSGSPLFDQNHRVIGQLHGGYAACGNDDSDWYGAFSVSWDGGGTSATRLSDWLDPDATGVMTVDTISGFGLTVDPGSDVEHIGEVGGPFSNDPLIYTLSNYSADPVSFEVTLGAGAAPLLLDGGTAMVSGTLAATGGTDTVTVTLDNPEGLAAGIYTREVSFYDVTNDRTSVVVHTLEIGQALIAVTPDDMLIASGPNGGPFPQTIVYTITSDRPTPVTVEVSAVDSWITVDGGVSPVTLNLSGVGDSDTVTIGIGGSAGSLATGLYTGSVDIVNVTDGNGDTTRDVSLEVGRIVYPAGDVPQPIADNTTITSVITIADAYCVGDVDVDMDISHTFIGDLILDLEAPDGTVVRLHDRSGSSADNIVTRYDEDGGTIPDGPGALTDFMNGSSVGDWTLTISDNAGSDTGTLNAWSLRIVPLGAACPPVAYDVDVTVPVLVATDIMLDAESIQGDPLVYIITSLPANADLFDPNGGQILAVPYTLLSNGDTVTFDPIGSFAGADVFQYKADDGQESNKGNVNVTVGGPQLVYDFPMDTDPMWDTTGDWAFGVPQGIDGDPSGGYTNEYVYGYNLAGEYPSSMPAETLTTSAIDFTDLTDSTLRFRRWLGVEHSTYDHAIIQISTDGAAWTEIWHNLPGFENTINETEWSMQEYDISAIADGEPIVYIRWVMGTTDSSVQHQGWNIDDVEIWAVTPFAGECPWDTAPEGGDGVVGLGDLNALLSNWGSCPAPCSWDFAPEGGDGVVGLGDLNALLSNWGPCP